MAQEMGIQRTKSEGLKKLKLVTIQKAQACSNKVTQEEEPDNLHSSVTQANRKAER